MILYNMQLIFITFRYYGNFNTASQDHPGLVWVDYCGLASLMVYIITSIYALYLFLKKLLQLVKMHATQVQSKSNFKLNKSQIVMMKTAAKYGSLLSVAIFANIFTSIGWSLLAFKWENEVGCCWNEYNAFLNQLMVLLTIIDVLINVICLYLQFKFASKYYNVYCKKPLEFICCCEKILTADVKKSMIVEFETIKTTESDSEN